MKRLLQLAALMFVSVVPAFAQNDFTLTPNLALRKPKIGSTNFGTYINGDFDTLDAAVGQFHGGFLVTPFSSTPVFNLTKGNTFQLTLTGNVISSSVNQPGVTAGQFLYLIVCQDGIGGRLFPFPASFQTPVPTISPTPNKCSASTWVWSASFNLWKVYTFQLTLTGNVISSSVNQPGVTAGQFLYLIACQDGTGGRTFAFPASFQTPVPTISPTPGKCSASTWVWSASFNLWINTGGSGGGGGGATPAPPAFALQKADAGATSLAASSIIDNGATITISEPVTLLSTLSVTGTTSAAAATFSGTLTASNTVVSNAFVSSTANPAGAGALRLAQLDSIIWRNAANSGNTVIIAPTAAIGNVPADTLGFPLGISPSYITDPSSLSSITGYLRLAPADTICWRNTANSSDACLSKDLSDGLSFKSGYLELGNAGLIIDGATSGTTTLKATAIAGTTTATFPANTGTVAELNLAQTWTANQSVQSGVEWRFFGPNGVNYIGLKGPGSNPGVNFTLALPSADSSGVQCISSNGSGSLAFSNCSAGTGSPGGSTTQVQTNLAGSFSGSPNLTWVSPVLTVGVAGSTTGQVALTGATSGTVTVTPQATAGTVTLTLPNVSGTVADGASVPLVLSATTGNLTCPTCSTSAAAATANQLMIGAAGQAIAALGTLGTATTVLHGGAGAPTFAAVNLATETTGVTAIANGGTNGATAAAGFDNLAPTTTRGDLIVRGPSGNIRLSLGGNGTCVVSNGTDALWGSCAAGTLSGNAVSGQGVFWNGTATVGGTANWLYSAASGHTVIQGANGADAFYMKRFTDTVPTGNFIRLQNAAANADLFKVDVNGNATLKSLTFTGTNAGGITLTQGPVQALVANSLQLMAPASVAAAGEQFIFPGNPASGFIRWTNSSGTLTGSFSAAAGIGNCGPNQVVQQSNDNAPPTCVSVAASMFASQAANSFLVAPNGSAGVPTFRVMASGDIPQIQLNSTAPGGVTNILPVANGGTGSSSATAAFDNLSPTTTQGDISYRGAANSTRLAPGTATQLLHSGTTPSWSAVSLTADVTGILPLANGGTNASSGLANTNGVVYSDGTKLVSTATGGAGTLCLTSTAGGVPIFGSCSGSTSTAWSSLSAPGLDTSLSMSTFNTLFTHGVMVGTRNIMEWTDGASTSTGSVINVHTNATSTMKPITITAQGTADGIQMTVGGLVQAIGNGGIKATTTNLTLNTTSPLTGGGALTGNLTFACATCVTSSAALTTNQIVIGSGGGQGTASLTAGTTKQILLAGAPPTYIDFPDAKIIPAANCSNATAGAGWSIASTFTPTCRAGTNNLNGVLNGIPSTGATAYFDFELPGDWDTAVKPYVSIYYGSGANTSGTVIWTVSTACTKQDGSITDDPAWIAESAMGTQTMAAANRMWAQNAQLAGAMTNCIAGSTMLVRAVLSGTAASAVQVSKAVITVPRLLTVQAN